MNSLSLQARLKTLVGLFVVGFMLVGALAARTIPRVVVNGPVYADIVRGKDLVADILPPPEYVIESYLVVLQLLREPDAAGQAALAARLETLRADFETRHAVWVRELPEGALKQKMVKESYEPAVAF
jgi:methyl-accepting chemotaxis protein